MRNANQPDLFSAAPRAGAPEPVPATDPAELEILRRNIYPLLEQAEAAERLPWDWTRTATIEISIESQRLRLPPEECAEVGRRLATALDRLWALEPPRAG